MGFVILSEREEERQLGVVDVHKREENRDVCIGEDERGGWMVERGRG